MTDRCLGRDRVDLKHGCLDFVFECCDFFDHPDLKIDELIDGGKRGRGFYFSELTVHIYEIWIRVLVYGMERRRNAEESRRAGRVMDHESRMAATLVPGVEPMGASLIELIPKGIAIQTGHRM